MSELLQVQAIYRAALHRLAGKACEYESKTNGQGRKLRRMIEDAMHAADQEVSAMVAEARRRAKGGGK